MNVKSCAMGKFHKNKSIPDHDHNQQHGGCLWAKRVAKGECSREA